MTYRLNGMSPLRQQSPVHLAAANSGDVRRGRIQVVIAGRNIRFTNQTTGPTPLKLAN
jgi:hypothetical protein